MALPSYDELTAQDQAKKPAELPSYEQLTAPSPAEPTPAPTPAPEAPQSLTDALNISGEPRTDKPGDIFRGAQLETVPLDVGKTLIQTPVISGVQQIYKAGQALTDVLFGGKSMAEAAAQRFPESQEFVGIEKKPIRERTKIGAGTLVNLLFGAEMGKGLGEPTRLTEPLTREPTAAAEAQPTEPIPLQAEQAAKEVIPSATQERQIAEGGVPEYPGVPQGANVPADITQVREVGGEPPSGGGGAVAEAPVAPEVVPRVTQPTVPPQELPRVSHSWRDKETGQIYVGGPNETHVDALVSNDIKARLPDGERTGEAIKNGRLELGFTTPEGEFITDREYGKGEKGWYQGLTGAPNKYLDLYRKQAAPEVAPPPTEPAAAAPPVAEASTLVEQTNAALAAAEARARGEAPPEPAAAAAAAPGELFPAKEIPFTLRGEAPPPEIGPEGAARAKAEAAYAQERAQTQMFEPVGEAQAVARRAPAIGDTVTLQHPALGELSGSVTRELSDGSFEVKTPQGDITVAPEELTVGRKSATALREEKVPTPAMESRMAREHEAQLKADFQQHAQAGGDELLDAVKASGGLPALSHPKAQGLRGELQNIREAYKAPRTERIKYSDIFKKDAPDIDALTRDLKAKGFPVETPADTLQLIQDRITSGHPVYGSEARGVAPEMTGLPGMGAARAGEIPEAPVVGMKNRMVDEERAKRGWLPLMQPARQEFGKVWDQAMARVETAEKNGENIGENMVNDVLSGRQKAVSNEDQAVLTHEYIRWRNERDMASDRINDPHTPMEDRVDAQTAFAAAEDRINQAELALHDAGTLAGRSLAFRKALVRDDFTYAGVERRMRAAKGGEPLSEEEVAKITEQTDKLAPLEEEATKSASADQEAATQKGLDLSIKDLKKRASREKGPVDLDDQREALHDALLGRAEEGETLEDAASLIHQLALNFVRSGITEREPLVDAVHNIIGEMFGASRAETADAISGYGKFKQLDPEAAKAQLRQIKGELQQLGKIRDMEAGIAPQKTGIERRTPSDEERRLIREVNEMKKKGGFEVTDPATQLKSALDGVKTRLTNQIRDIANAIDTRQPIQGKKTELPYDAEAQKLKQIRDVLKGQYDEIFGKKGMTDEQRLKVAQSAAERSLRDANNRLEDAKAGKFTGPDKKKLTTPEIDAIRAQRDSINAEVEALAQQDPGVQASRLSKQLAIQEQRLQQRIADMQGVIAREEFGPKPPKPERITSPETLKLQAQVNGLREQINQGIMREQMKNRTTPEVMMDTFLKYRRGFVLSWPTIFTKLTSAAFLRLVSEPIEAGLRRGLGVIPGVRQVAERAAIGGQTSVGSLANATAKAFTAGLKDSWQTARTGKSDLDRLYGRPDALPREWIDFFGTLHAVLKAPIKRYGFELAMRDQMENAMRNGLTRDPITESQMAIRAYAYGERLIFLQNNRAVSAFNMAMRRLEQPAKGELHPSVALKTGATLAKTPFPVLKVPTNVVSEIMDYTFGGFTGGAKLFKALREPINNLKPEQAETIMRQLSKGALGGALLYLGYINRDKIGGYFQRGEKRKPEEPKPGEIIINGHRFTHDLFHSAIAGPLMVGATMGRVADTQIKGVPKGAAEGVMHAILGPVTEVPFYTGVEKLLETAKAPSLTTAAGQQISDIVIPGAVQQAARLTDKGPAGEPRKVVPHTFGEAFKSKIPGLRKTVPEKGATGEAKIQR